MITRSLPPRLPVMTTMVTAPLLRRQRSPRAATVLTPATARATVLHRALLYRLLPYPPTATTVQARRHRSHRQPLALHHLLHPQPLPQAFQPMATTKLAPALAFRLTAITKLAPVLQLMATTDLAHLHPPLPPQALLPMAATNLALAFPPMVATNLALASQPMAATSPAPAQVRPRSHLQPLAPRYLLHT
jgi:hypothetical protein